MKGNKRHYSGMSDNQRSSNPGSIYMLKVPVTNKNNKGRYD